MSINDVSPDYDVTPDGASFVLLTDNTDATPKKIHIVLNFFEELTERIGS